MSDLESHFHFHEKKCCFYKWTGINLGHSPKFICFINFQAIAWKKEKIVDL
jgi:hypothetical protein